MKKIYLCFLFLIPFMMNAQTDIDALMMKKNDFCFGAVYQYSSWNEYWEGTFKRENLNLGTVSSQGPAFMGDYGVLDKLNFLLTVPYVETKATAGTMKGQKGIQDLTFTLKYMPIKKNIGNVKYSLILLGSYSTPGSDYAPDYLPLSLGLGSNTGTFRLMGDVQYRHFFATLSGAYLKRGNITIDRNSYLDNEIHYTNEVDMPDLINVNFRFGYRSSKLIAEAIIDNSVTQSGGFNITKNNMPFPSNTMNAFKLGVNGKYTVIKQPELAIVGGYNVVTEGRNVGEATSFYGGIFYLINFNKKSK
ncbi:hypothetical protein EYY60_02910 [Flavobacterium zhairuonense]|uniref:hypothetical protein n=1 Tax=Flavobacterium zhairuonense TaxID=2493631 RepID=UPI00104E478C|nr:hypothetical protein [Flavobacterium zhairuonense]KAF2515024.1 hypothetical protein EYY60_02910 [Flavobacterium zhairuonense]